MQIQIQNHTRSGRQGFTLVESLIAVTFLAVLFLAVAQTSSRASDAFDEGSVEHSLSTSTHRCLERITQTIEFASGAILGGLGDETLGAAEVSFETPIGWAGTEVEWSGPIVIRAELETGELNDGLDNDGDELIDELQVVQLENGGRIVLARGVAELYQGEIANNEDDNGNVLKDERGLSFSASGNVVTVRLTCQRRDEAGRLLTKTAETAVRLRNTAAGG